MGIDHDTLVGFAKSFGLLYLIAMAAVVLAYACWPSNGPRFDKAAATSSTTRTSRGGRGTRSPQRPQDHRPRMERHQGAEHAGAAAGLVLPDRHVAVRDRLLDADAGLADRRHLHQGPARRGRPRRGHREGQAGRARARGLDDQIASQSFAQILADPAPDGARPRGRRARCSATTAPACHGADAKGGKGFPSLVDRDWLWGGSPKRSPRRSASGSTARIRTRASRRCSPSAATGSSTRDEIANVADYVLSLSTASAPRRRPSVGRGRARRSSRPMRGLPRRRRPGQPELGAPNLTDRPGSTAATGSRSTPRSGAAGKGRCRPGKAG